LFQTNYTLIVDWHWLSSGSVAFAAMRQVENDNYHNISTICQFLIAHATFQAVTMEQMDKAAALIGEICLKKFKPSAELRAGLHKGEYPNDRELKCYVNCVMEMLQTMKKGKVNYDSALKQIDVMLPDEMKEPTRKSLEACKNSGKWINVNLFVRSIELIGLIAWNN
jgi:PBP/GOBP family